MLGELDSGESDSEVGKYRIFGLNFDGGSIAGEETPRSPGRVSYARLSRPVLSDCCPTVRPKF